MIKRCGFYIWDERDQIAPMLDRACAQLDFLSTVIKRRGIALDVGAHVGVYTKLLAKNFEEVVAFEPLTANFDCLVRNCWGLENVRLRNVALANSNGIAEFKTPNSSNSVSSHVAEVHEVNERGKFTAEGPVKLHQPVLLRKLDTMVLCPDFIKIDAEGLDLQVLRGAEWVIKKHRPIIMVEDKIKTTHPSWYKEGEIEAYLKSLGMRLVQTMDIDKFFVWD